MIWVQPRGAAEKVPSTFAAHSGDRDIDVATLAAKESENEILIRHTYTLCTPLNRSTELRKKRARSSVLAWRQEKKVCRAGSNRLGRPRGARHHWVYPSDAGPKCSEDSCLQRPQPAGRAIPQPPYSQQYQIPTHP